MSRDDGLTPQQARVAMLVADGEPDKKIAAFLGISVQTVRFHIRRIALRWDIPAEKVTRIEIARRVPRNAA